MVGAHSRAGAALHTGIGYPVVPPVFFNGISRTNLPAGAADDAVVSYKVSHGAFSLYPMYEQILTISHGLFKNSQMQGTRNPEE